MPKELRSKCGESGRTSGSVECPSLCVWRPGAHVVELAQGEIRVWVVDLDDGLTPAQVETSEPGPELSLLARDEQERACRFIRARDRRRFARCRAALRTILGGLLEQPASSLKFRAAVSGKPELESAGTYAHHAGKQLDLRFNVSHSSELALIGVCRGQELGVDLEQVRTVHEADRIVASFFSPAEHAEFATIADDVKALAFFRGWTRKEAILKGLGIGLAGLSARYETRVWNGRACRLILSRRPRSPRVDEMAALGSRSSRWLRRHGGGSRPDPGRSDEPAGKGSTGRRCLSGRRRRRLNGRTEQADEA